MVFCPRQFSWFFFTVLAFLDVYVGTVSFFSEPTARGDGLGRGSRAGVLIMFPYKSPYSKAIGKDGILVCHDHAVMHCQAAERAVLQYSVTNRL